MNHQANSDKVKNINIFLSIIIMTIVSSCLSTRSGRVGNHSNHYYEDLMVMSKTLGFSAKFVVQRGSDSIFIVLIEIESTTKDTLIVSAEDKYLSSRSQNWNSKDTISFIYPIVGGHLYRRTFPVLDENFNLETYRLKNSDKRLYKLEVRSLTDLPTLEFRIFNIEKKGGVQIFVKLSDRERVNLNTFYIEEFFF